MFEMNKSRSLKVHNSASVISNASLPRALSFLSYFFVKKIPLSRHVEYVI